MKCSTIENGIPCTLEGEYLAWTPFREAKEPHCKQHLVTRAQVANVLCRFAGSWESFKLFATPIEE